MLIVNYASLQHWPTKQTKQKVKTMRNKTNSITLKPTTKPAITTKPTTKPVSTNYKLGSAPINTAVAVAVITKPAAAVAVATPINKVNKWHGANNNKAISAFLLSQHANGTVLKTKNTLATLWHCYNAFTGSTVIKAVAIQHTCAPTLYYNNSAMYNKLVADAHNGKHYACSAFKGLYQGNTNKLTKKAIAALLARQPIVSQLLILWQPKINTKAFFAYLTKLSA